LASPFFTTRPRHRGLGLAAVYGILHLHCGGLAFDDRPGGGTVARFVLPIVRSRIADQDQGANAPRSPSSASREKVLVVDDDPMVLRFVSTTLERGGYRVQTAQSGDEALRRYQDSTAEPFRLVLSDVAMPLMNGVDLARRLVQHDAQVNLLFMSGQVSPDFAPENWGGAPFPLLRKPFHPEGLLRAVRAALDCGRPPAASEVDSPAGPAAALTSSP
jgi:CheY-like chemotaxis protein